MGDLTAVVEGTFDDGLPLPDRLTQLAERWQGIAAVSLTSDGRVFEAVADDPGLRTWVFEIVEEGINNAVTHGRATRVDVQIEMPDHLIEVSVRDDGVGLHAGGQPGLGLTTIGRSPARLTISALPSGGCQLLVALPRSMGGRRG